MTITKADAPYSPDRIGLLPYEDQVMVSYTKTIPDYYTHPNDQSMYGKILRAFAREQSRFEYSFQASMLANSQRFQSPPMLKRNYASELYLDRRYPYDGIPDSEYRRMVLGLIDAYRSGATIEGIRAVVSAYTTYPATIEENYKKIGTGLVDVSDRNSLSISIQLPLTTTSQEEQVAPVPVYIYVPNDVIAGEEFTASVKSVFGATYQWSVVGCVVVSGLGTNTVILRADVVTPVGISINQIENGVIRKGYAGVNVIPAPNVTFTMPEYIAAGTFNRNLAVTVPDSWHVVWSGTNVEIEGPNNESNVSFDIGHAEALAIVTVSATDGVSVLSHTAQSKVVPYTSVITHTTAVLAPGGSEDCDLDLGWEWDLLSFSMNNPGQIRIYATDAARDHDFSRDPNTDPTGDVAILFEGSCRTVFGFDVSTMVRGINGDSPRTKKAYCRVYNLGSSPSAVGVSLVRTELRTSGVF